MNKVPLYFPFDPKTISQEFGANANPLYSGQGLKGHSGTDFALPYGTVIKNCVPGSWVYLEYHKDDPNLMDYRAVLTLYDAGDYLYEISYGHCSLIEALVGSMPSLGQDIAQVGDTGPVYAGGHEVTEAEKEANPHLGEHVHFQVRRCRLVPATHDGDVLLQDASGVYRYRGGYVIWDDPKNGYNSCVDPRTLWNGLVVGVDQRDANVFLAENAGEEVDATPEQLAEVVKAVTPYADQNKLWAFIKGYLIRH